VSSQVRQIGVEEGEQIGRETPFDVAGQVFGEDRDGDGGMTQTQQGLCAVLVGQPAGGQKLCCVSTRV